jgi:Histidine kinase-, DNA gyrase B-, and HSP90-like ATPase
MDGTPSSKILYAFRAERPSYSQLAAEAIDNSLDAKASEITVVMNDAAVSVADNGVGVTRDRVVALVRYGEHAPMASTRLGMFGVGIKLQAVKTGRYFTVASTSADGHMRLEVDWDAVERSGTWIYPDPIWRHRRSSERFGTTIWISGYRSHAPRHRDVDKAMTDLMKYFYPALVGGARITVNDHRLQAPPEPRLTERLAGEVDVRPGKGAHYIAGLLADLGPIHHVHVAYGHRVIEPESSFGCGHHGGLRRFYARVTLVGAWQLARFKDEVVDDDADLLRELLEAAWLPLLEQCEAKELDLRVNEITMQLNEMLPPELVCARPPRKGGGGGGGGGRPQKRRPGITNEGEPSGPARRRRPPINQLKIEFVDGLHAEYGYGRFLDGQPARIELAKDNPHIALWLESRDRQVALTALYSKASSLYIEARQRGTIQDLFEPDDPFGLRMWKLMRDQTLPPDALGP